MLEISRSDWHSTGAAYLAAPVGQSLKEILDNAYADLSASYPPLQLKTLKKYAIVTVNGERIPRKKFATTYPALGSHIHIHRRVQGGGGGGGGKGIVQAIVGVVIAVVAVGAAIFTGGASLGLSAALGQSALWGLTTYGGIAAFGAAIALTGVISAISPQPAMPSLGSLQPIDVGSTSSAYSISGVRNNLRPNEPIPVIFGRHRVTPPLGAKNWTVWEGDKQFFHMLVIWGQPELEVSEFRIGDTPLENYTEVEHICDHGTGDNLKYFGKSYNEQNVGTELNQSSGWVTRTIGEAEDLSIDISFQGLFSVNKESGKVRTAGVWFELQYRKTIDDTWKGFDYYDPISFNASEITVYAPVTYEVFENKYNFPTVNIYLNKDGTLSHNKGDFLIYPTKHPDVQATVKSYRLDRGSDYEPRQNRYGNNITISISDGVLKNLGDYYLSNDDREFKVFNIRKEGLPKAIYEVRIRRTTADTDSQYLYDKASWSTARAILNQPAFSSIYPVKYSELRIKASEQLSSFIDDFNAICHSVCPCWDGVEWTEKTTSNPAALARYALTNISCNPDPYDIEGIDDVDYIAAYEYFDEKGYEFNLIADTKVLTWDRQRQILGPARAVPTVDNNGKWGIILDVGGKPKRQLYSHRNSWGMNVQRTFPDLPHAGRVSFINKDKGNGYERDEIYVCMDGYTLNPLAEPHKELATDIRAYTVEGIVDYEQVVRKIWHDWAVIQHRSILVKLNSDWEYLAIRRGDVVDIASHVVLNTYGDGKIVALVYENEDTQEEIIATTKEEIPQSDDENSYILVGLQLDDTVKYNHDVRWGIKIRYDNGIIGDFELDVFYDKYTEHKTLYFKYPPPASATPNFGNLCDVGDFLKKSYGEYVYAGATVGDNFQAEMSFVPYAQPLIQDAADTQTIPPYEPPIILDVAQGVKIPPPIITAIKSNEDVLTVLPNGTTSPTIKAWLQQPAGNTDTSKVYYQISAKLNGGTPLIADGQIGQNYISISGVTEKQIYAVRVRAIDISTGITSDWTAAQQIEVIGRTTPPPSPSAVLMNGNMLQIEQVNRPLDVVGHVVTIAMDATDTITMGRVVTTPYITNGELDLTPWAGRARRVYVETIDEIGLKSTPVSIAINLGDIIPDNVIVRIKERDKNWSGDIKSGYVDVAGDLSAGQNVDYFAASGQSYFPTSGQEYFSTGTGATLEYMYSFFVDRDYIGASIFVEPITQSGRVLSIEYRTFAAVPYFAESGQPYFALSGQEYFPRSMETEWKMMPDKYTVTQSTTLQIKLTTINSELTVFDDIITNIDVPDRELVLSDFDIAADGLTRLPLPQSTFRAIVGIQGTLQYIEGDTGVALEFVRGSEIKEGDFITQGTLLRVVDANKQLTAGNADITVKGY